MSVTVESIKARFPEFAGIPDATVAIYLDEAETTHNATQWGLKSDLGLSYLTAHLIAEFGPPAQCDEPGAGPVTSEKEGAVAVSYAVADRAKQSDYGSTKYGRRYIQLLSTIFVTRCT